MIFYNPYQVWYASDRFPRNAHSEILASVVALHAQVLISPWVTKIVVEYFVLYVDKILNRLRETSASNMIE